MEQVLTSCAILVCLLASCSKAIAFRPTTASRMAKQSALDPDVAILILVSFTTPSCFYPRSRCAPCGSRDASRSTAGVVNGSTSMTRRNSRRKLKWHPCSRTSCFGRSTSSCPGISETRAALELAQANSELFNRMLDGRRSFSITLAPASDKKGGPRKSVVIRKTFAPKMVLGQEPDDSEVQTNDELGCLIETGNPERREEAREKGRGAGEQARESEIGAVSCQLRVPGTRRYVTDVPLYTCKAKPDTL